VGPSTQPARPLREAIVTQLKWNAVVPRHLEPVCLDY